MGAVKYDVVKNKLDEMARKLEETKDVSAFSAGPVNDSVKIIVPMMEDMLEIVREVLERTSDSPLRFDE